MTAVHTWEVIGGAISGGLLVRSGRALGSERESQRLRTGSVVEQIELDGERLHYKLLEGAGPLTGWVSTKLGGRELLQRCSSTTSGTEKSKEDFLRKASNLQVAHMDIIAVALNVAPTVQTGPRFRVTKVCDDTLLEIEPSEAAVSLEDFWPKDCPFDSKKQHYVYWAIVCSSSCDTWTMALALTLKELSDYGVILTHESRPVTNIVVLNTPTMDVGDLLPTAVELLEPGSGARVSMFSTPASQLTLKMLGPEVKRDLVGESLLRLLKSYEITLSSALGKRLSRRQCRIGGLPQWCRVLGAITWRILIFVAQLMAPSAAALVVLCQMVKN